MKINFIKRRKGFSMAQVLAYAIISVIVLTSFFAMTAASRGASLKLSNKNDVMYQIYDINKLENEIKYAKEIVYICDNNVADGCKDGDRKITVVDKSGKYEKTYEYKDGKIVLSENKENGVVEVPQYFSVEDISFEKASIVQNDGTNNVELMKAIKMNVKFRKNEASYNHETMINPISWMN